MTRAHLILALCSIAGTTTVLPANDCNCGKTGQSTKCCCVRDDSGLLDVVDRVAGRLHSEVRRNMVKIVRLPAFGHQTKATRQVPSVDCDCQACQSIGKNSIEDSQIAPPLAIPNHTNTTHSNESSGLRVLAPIPDSQVDPFVDESVRTGQSKVQGKTIQYRQSTVPSRSDSVQPKSTRSSETRPKYGQQYTHEAQRTPSTADYWAQDNHRDRPLQMVAPASNQDSTLEEVFRPAYRLSLRDANAQSAQSAPANQSNQLRPVPTAESDRRSLPENDPNPHYEREIKPTPIFDNPLRR